MGLNFDLKPPDTALADRELFRSTLIKVLDGDPLFAPAYVEWAKSFAAEGNLTRAVALAQLGDFPRASVALEDALVGDPIELLSAGRRAPLLAGWLCVAAGWFVDWRRVAPRRGFRSLPSGSPSELAIP